VGTASKAPMPYLSKPWQYSARHKTGLQSAADVHGRADCLATLRANAATLKVCSGTEQHCAAANPAQHPGKEPDAASKGCSNQWCGRKSAHRDGDAAVMVDHPC
jgi:hypothetical protein